MLDLMRFDDKSALHNPSVGFRKIQDNSFTVFRKYKGYNSSEDRLIFNKLSNTVVLKWEERLTLLKEYLIKNKSIGNSKIQNLDVTKKLLGLAGGLYDFNSISNFVMETKQMSPNSIITVKYTTAYYLPLKMLF